jgi:hypothetical protein
LESFTQGRYRRVWTPLSDNVLLVDDGDGKPHGVEVLSRGSREQLFLCLRMALVGSYARRGIALPMVLDDVLVNFDTHRAKSAVEVLRDFATAGHQLLVFTCHEHIAAMFQSLEVEVHTLPGHAGPQQAEPPVPARPPRAKRKRKPPPEPEPEVEDPPEQPLAIAADLPVVEPPEAEVLPEELVEPMIEEIEDVEVVAPPADAADADALEPMEELAPWEEDDGVTYGSPPPDEDVVSDEGGADPDGDEYESLEDFEAFEEISAFEAEADDDGSDEDEESDSELDESDEELFEDDDPLDDSDLGDDEFDDAAEAA